jgi:chorismate mutase/prephenate dehydratase
VVYKHSSDLKKWFKRQGMLSMSEDLNQLREAIDCLDDEILQALTRRMRLSDQVIAAKNGVAAFRPGREAVLVRRLIAKSKATGQNLAPEAILGVWRQIMAASLSRQNGELVCAVHHQVLPAAAWHMGSALAATVDEKIAPLIDAVAVGQCQYALVPADNNHHSELLASLDRHHHLKIIARTPLYDMQAVKQAFIIADYLPDSSGDDISLYAVRREHRFNLVSIAGYYELAPPSGVPDDARLIGAYACY